MNRSQPRYKRQRFLLSLICQLGSVSSTELQQLVFLYTMENDTGHYEFIPCKYGAYSFQLAQDVGNLRKDGFLFDDGTSIRATGEYPMEGFLDVAVERGNNLIRRAYREYPYYTMTSDMADDLFHDKTEEKLFFTERLKYTKAEQVLFTIGNEGKSIDAFIYTLMLNGVELLCDVRKNPISRKLGFSKGKLEHITETVGMKYVHIPNLGIESDKRCSLATAEDYQTLFDDYLKELPNLAPYLDRVYSLLCSNTRIALMCYEKDAAMCHRHMIRDYVTSRQEIWSEDL